MLLRKDRGRWSGEVLPPIYSAVCVRRVGAGFMFSDVTLSMLSIFMGLNFGLLKTALYKKEAL